jgi:hypothetical protein
MRPFPRFCLSDAKAPKFPARRVLVNRIWCPEQQDRRWQFL